MHYLVRLIVEGEDINEAMSQARCVMDNLVEWREFDWYRYDGDDCAWEDYWKPARLDSETGKAWVKDAMDVQFVEFKHCMKAIRHMVLNYSDEQIFDEDFGENLEVHLSRYYFSKASGYHANACLLYDTNGASITDSEALEYYLQSPDNLWVVQVDCHN